jgi:hypothetical protein
MSNTQPPIGESGSTLEPNPPIIGPNTTGLIRTERGHRLVRVEFISTLLPFVYVRDIETNKPHVIYRNDLKMTQNIPAKYREERFQRVAHVWGAALNAYPNAIEVNPSPLSFFAYARLLRDARTAKDKYGWQHPAIRESLWQHAASITVTEAESGIGVLLGPTEAKFPPRALPAGVVAETDMLEFRWSNEAELEAFCLLHDKKCVWPRQSFYTTGLTTALVASLEERYDIGFVPHESDATKWLIV